jgi:hypothetical protein
MTQRMSYSKGIEGSRLNGDGKLLSEGAYVSEKASAVEQTLSTRTEEGLLLDMFKLELIYL